MKNFFWWKWFWWTCTLPNMVEDERSKGEGSKGGGEGGRRVESSLQHRLVRFVQCFKALITSFDSIKDLFVDIVENHFEVHVASLLNVVLLEWWSQCFPRWFHGWTRCPRWWRDVTMEQIVLSLCVCSNCFAPLLCSIASMLNTVVFRQSLEFPRSIWRTSFFVRTFFFDNGNGTFRFQQKTLVLRLQVALIDHRLVLGLVRLVGNFFFLRKQ